MKHPFINIILPILLFYLCIQVYYFLAYTPPNYVLPLTWDKFGYYLYLPAVFIYHDLLHLGFVDGLMKKYELSGYFYQAHLYPNGNKILTYTLGLALLEFPFFCLGHLSSILLGYPRDGFSLPYQFCITLGGTFYSMLGIWYTYKNLRFFFKENVSLLTLGIIIFCTNYFYYSAIENGMTHTYLFSLYAVIIYCTIKWHQAQELKYAIWLGVCIGLAVTIRPSEIIVCLIPIFWNVQNKESISIKVKLLFKNYTQIIFLAISVIAIGSIQLFYWKYATGHWLYNSYKESGLSFDFLRPQLIRGIFSIKKGWLVFTPVMILSFLGLGYLYRLQKRIFLPVIIYMFLNIYIVFSWCVWDYGGGFGSRALVQSYAVLVLPIGFTVQYFLSKDIFKWICTIFILACCVLNLLQTLQYAKGLLSTGGLSTYSYRLLFGQLSINLDDIKRFEKLDIINDHIIMADTVCYISFKDSLGASNIDSATKSLVLSKDPYIFYKGFLNAQKSDYIEIYGQGQFDHIEYNYDNEAAMRLDFFDGKFNMLYSKLVKIEPLMYHDAEHLNADYLGDAGVPTEFQFAVKRPYNSRALRLSAFNTGGNRTLLSKVIIKSITK